MDTQTDQDQVSQFLQNYMAAQPPAQPPAPVPSPEVASNPLFQSLSQLQAPADTTGTPAPPKISAPNTSPSLIPQPYKTPGTPNPETEQAVEHAHQVEQSKSGIDSLWGKTSNIQNPFLKALARIGTVGLYGADAAGTMFAPAATSVIPGSHLNHAVAVAQAENQAKDAQARDEATTANTVAQVGADVAAAKPEEFQSKLDAMAAQHTAALAQKDKTTEEQYAAHGFKTLPDGTHVFDPDSPVGKRMAEKALVDQSVIEEKTASTELKKAQADFEKTKNDPNSPGYQLAIGRLQTARQNAADATMRAQAYMNNYQMHAHGTEPDGVTPLNAAQMLDGKPVGTVVATGLDKILPKQQQMADVAIGISHTRTALKTLEGEGGTLNTVPMAAALADPEHSSQQWAQGKVKSTLSSAERDVVIQVTALKERIMAMRSAAGSGVTDAQVKRLQAMLPNASTPDFDTAQRQLDEVQSQLNTLAAGVPGINRAGTTPAAGGAVPGTNTYKTNGNSYTFPAGSDVEKRFLTKYPNAVK